MSPTLGNEESAMWGVGTHALIPGPIRVGHSVGNTSHPQSLLDFVDRSDSIGAVSVGDGSVFLVGIVTEQEHLLAVKGVLGPGNVQQRAGSSGTSRMVGILVVDEVDCRGPRQQSRPEKKRGSHLRTERVRPDMVAGEIVNLRKFTAVDRTNVEQVLPAFPHWVQNGFRVSSLHPEITTVVRTNRMTKRSG